MNNLRTFVGKYAPNHKEFGRWVDITSDVNGSIIKVYHNGKWTEETHTDAKQNTFTKDEVLNIMVNHCKGLQQQIDNLLEKVNFLGREIKRLKKGTAIAE